MLNGLAPIGECESEGRDTSMPRKANQLMKLNNVFGQRLFMTRIMSACTSERSGHYLTFLCDNGVCHAEIGYTRTVSNRTPLTGK